MQSKHFDMGIVGLGVMGANLGLNIASRGRRVAGYDPDSAKAHTFGERGAAELDAASGAQTAGSARLEDFVNALKTPRVLVLLVPANIVDSAIDSLVPHLAAGDILIDGGNSHFPDTERRLAKLAAASIHFIGMGVSGGEEGARHGPSMMPGGEAAAWERVRPLLEPAAAKAADGAPCIAWIGNSGSGHFVKMVHNGIEYGLMQLIAETYDLMYRGLGLPAATIREHFTTWSQHQLAGYLIEITADILAQQDADGSLLLEHIRDAARQKGTGRWTTEAALALGIPTPTIDAAVTARGLSDFHALRQDGAKRFAGPLPATQQALLADAGLPAALEGALQAAMLLTYAQGMHLIATANAEYDYGLDSGVVARIWRGGCIIRAALLEDLSAAYARDPELGNPAFDDALSARLGQLQSELRRVVAAAATAGIPVPALGSALAYYDALRSPRLPANLIQAQRDYFGAHTYERLDREGTFHTQWTHGSGA
ncbi:NADP-dependent phosphogluconate dehydrogenase [Acidihalobacter ferrooxydans]|uniref:6-phosphogluconate dehydrogenase, decarboxylating n=1 Tax=Acidihalobacter ferrooxydans TaxID=1765967 RepID=A0A1P8UHK5_9GAMM|nr:NADP-dependent phosphogluconate dehydrogenase [Acidihalobacter ferrooxydans]APZ43325.1 phosphogluconate dehydrogenase (NADP(+)-dependent, decarboxylating) [Acidihalobacter ferrooxydans]